jgi:hypothetical protein
VELWQGTSHHLRSEPPADCHRLFLKRLPADAPRDDLMVSQQQAGPAGQPGRPTEMTADGSDCRARDVP